MGAAAAEPQSAYAMGAIVSTLPSGCVYQMMGSAAYYNCSQTWFTPSYGANGVYYRVVPAP
jgi:membrane associated rhomboid family serine protease